jgi:hypothetical protein
MIENPYKLATISGAGLILATLKETFPVHGSGNTQRTFAIDASSRCLKFYTQLKGNGSRRP